MKTLSARLRHADRQLSLLAFQNVSGNLAATLLDLAQTHGRDVPEGVKIDIELTHQEIADLVGTAREVVTKIINDFKRDNCVSFEGRYCIILNEEKLKAWIY